MITARGDDMDQDQDTRSIENLTESYRHGPYRKQPYSVRETPDHLDAGLHELQAESDGISFEEYTT
jgi:hypothetical protein